MRNKFICNQNVSVADSRTCGVTKKPFQKISLLLWSLSCFALNVNIQSVSFSFTDCTFNSFKKEATSQRFLTLRVLTSNRKNALLQREQKVYKWWQRSNVPSEGQTGYVEKTTLMTTTQDKWEKNYFGEICIIGHLTYLSNWMKKVAKKQMCIQTCKLSVKEQGFAWTKWARLFEGEKSTGTGGNEHHEKAAEWAGIILVGKPRSTNCMMGATKEYYLREGNRNLTEVHQESNRKKGSKAGPIGH